MTGTLAYGEAITLTIIDQLTAMTKQRLRPWALWLYAFEMKAFEAYLQATGKSGDLKNGYFHGIQILTCSRVLKPTERYQFLGKRY